MEPLMAWMLSRAGLQPEAYRAAAMQRRLPACLRHLRVPSANAARKLLERQPELIPHVINSVLVGVSEFFRDRPVFEYVESVVLPELLRTRSGVRVCGAGVSGGQEVYSMAMLLAETGVLAQSTLLGVDCRADAIRCARRGWFSSDDVAGVDVNRRSRFFRRTEGHWEVIPAIRKQIQWQMQDILALEAGGNCDLILFRNVAIYFSNTYSARAWDRLCDQLTPGGFLITGKAEKPPVSLPLTRVVPSVYRKNQS
jgi:chemotaxis methyl-accepting protein methylase